jgi:hypothetical protein
MRRVVASLVTASLLMAGCGTASPEITIDDGFDAVAAATSEAATARIRLQVEHFHDDEPLSVHVVEGVVDFLTGNMRAELTHQVPGNAQAQARQQSLTIDGYHYQQQPDGTWLRAGTGQPATGSSGAGISLPRPDEMLDQLRDVANIERVGADLIDGQSVTHFRGEMAASDPDGAGDMFNTATLDVWVDDLRRLRRLITDTTIKSTLGADTRFTATLDLTDFGVAVDLSPPPTDQIVDAEQQRREQSIERAGVEPAPLGNAPTGLPDGFPASFPFPEGTTVVAVEAGRVVLSSPPPPDEGSDIWSQRVELLLSLSLAGRESFEGSGGSAGSESVDANGNTTERSSRHPVVLDGRKLITRTAWATGDTATTIEIEFRD